jgi:dihydroorotase
MYHTTPHNKDEVQNEIASAKIYMAKSSALPAITSVEVLKYLFKKFPMISIHAEDETEFDTSQNRSPLHHENRPRKSITGALNKIETAVKAISKKDRPRIVICHMNTSDEVDWVSGMKDDGFDIWGETCPHYLFFTHDNYIKQGTMFQVNPPIRTQKDQLRLREGISNSEIDFMGTDHAPHSIAEKQSKKAPSGIAAIEWFVPQMLHFVDEGKISWQRFNQLMCENASSCYSIKGRDGIKKGNFADLVFVKKSNKNELKNNIHTKVGLNLYKDFNFKWQVAATMVNGVLKYDGTSFEEHIKGTEV